MDGRSEGQLRIKKLSQPTSREVTSELILLRALQLGLRITDLELLSGGQLTDLMVEKNNDSYDYPRKATTEDYDRFFG